jgi:hypothetical protein
MFECGDLVLDVLEHVVRDDEVQGAIRERGQAGAGYQSL